jgi:hypothetical protein
MIYVCSLKIDNAHLLEGKEVLTTIPQLYQVLWDKSTREIEILDDFAQEYFTPSGMVAFVEEAKKLNPYLRLKIEKNYGIYYDQMALELRKLKNVGDIVDYFLHNSKEAIRMLHHLCDNYSSHYSEALVANNKLNTLHLEVTEARRRTDAEVKKNELQSLLFAETRAKLETIVSRINYNYDKDLDSDKLLGLDVGIPSYRRILYIKEVTRVHYVDTLIYYLQEILKTLYGVPARLVIIEAAFAYERAALYPNCVRHTDLTFRDVVNSNIYMAGFHPNLMEDILKNPSNADYLIVLDRSGFDRPYLRGENVEGLVTVSDQKDLGTGLVNRNRIISYSNTTMHIPFIKDFNNLSMEEKIGKYSSMQATKDIINLLERGSH